MNFTTLDHHLSSYLSRTKLPGMSLAISDRGRTLHTFTYTSEREAGSPITPASLFEIGSTGKSFTSILFQQLVDRDGYDLHKPVAEILPWFDIASEFEPFTTHHLLSHTAGIINGTDFSGDTLGEVYALRETQTASPPGTFFHYSNVGYKLLGAILEHITQRPYPDLVRERILHPLGLEKVYPAITHDLRPRMAVGYIPLFDDRPAPLDYPIAPGPRLETATADGCIVANPSDLARYMRMLMQGGDADVLSAEGFGRMIQPVLQTDEDSHYGYGLSIAQTPDGRFIGHSGGMAGGYSTQMLWHVETGLGFTAMFNAVGVPGAGAVIDWLKQGLVALGSGNELPPLNAPVDPLIVPDATRYAGHYGAGQRTLTVLAQEERLFLAHNGAEEPLAMRGPARFTCAHPDFDRFVFAFQAANDEPIRSVTHGETLYWGEGAAQPPVDYPAEWEALRGHYRSHNPWMTSFRVLLRAGKLLFQMGGEGEEALVPLDNGDFRVGEDEKLPERLRFDLTIGGQAIRAHVNNAAYYRTFTP